MRNSAISGRRLAGPSAGSGWSLYVSAQQWAGEITHGLYAADWDQVIREFDARTARAEKAVAATPGATGTSPVARVESFRDREYTADAKAKFSVVPIATYSKKAVARLYWLWSTADASPYGASFAHRLFQVWHVVLAVFTVAGLLHFRRHLAEHYPLWLVAAYLTALHFLYHVEARYTVPARPFVWIYAAAAIDYWIAKFAQRATSGTRYTVSR
jgi:hypothetical protein